MYVVLLRYTFCGLSTIIDLWSLCPNNREMYSQKNNNYFCILRRSFAFCKRKRVAISCIIPDISTLTNPVLLSGLNWAAAILALCIFSTLEQYHGSRICHNKSHTLVFTFFLQAISAPSPKTAWTAVKTVSTVQRSVLVSLMLHPLWAVAHSST